MATVEPKSLIEARREVEGLTSDAEGRASKRRVLESQPQSEQTRTLLGNLTLADLVGERELQRAKEVLAAEVAKHETGAGLERRRKAAQHHSDVADQTEKRYAAVAAAAQSQFDALVELLGDNARAGMSDVQAMSASTEVVSGHDRLVQRDLALYTRDTIRGANSEFLAALEYQMQRLRYAAITGVTKLPDARKEGHLLAPGEIPSLGVAPSFEHSKRFVKNDMDFLRRFAADAMPKAAE